MLIAIQNQAEWRRLCDVVLGDVQLVSDVRFANNTARIANVDQLEESIQSLFLSLPASEVMERLRKADLAIASVNTLADVWQHEQLRERGRFVETLLPGGFATETLKLPIDISSAMNGNQFAIFIKDATTTHSW